MGRRLHPRPRAQHRQRRQHTEASRGCADLWLQGRAGDVRDPDLGAGGGLARPRPQAPSPAQAAGVDAAAAVAQPPVVVHDRSRAIGRPPDADVTWTWTSGHGTESCKSWLIIISSQ